MYSRSRGLILVSILETRLKNYGMTVFVDFMISSPRSIVDQPFLNSAKEIVTGTLGWAVLVDTDYTSR